MADDRLTFEKATEYWLFCTIRLLGARYERAVVLARTGGHRELLARMLDKYLTETRMERRRMAVEGDEAGAAAADLVLQKGHDDRYAGPLRHGRFQVMESLTPAGTYYVADHTLPDLLLREAGPASEVRRFAMRGAAEDYTDRLAERPAELATPAASRRAALNLPPSGAGRGATTRDYIMAKAKKAETPTATKNGGAKRTGVGARARELIMAGKLTDDEIFTILSRDFGMDESKKGHISWYRYDLRRKGQNPPGPVGSTRAARGATKAAVKTPAPVKAVKPVKAAEVKALKGRAPVGAVVAGKAAAKKAGGKPAGKSKL